MDQNMKYRPGNKENGDLHIANDTFKKSKYAKTIH
jgi:hypothetical protein